MLYFFAFSLCSEVRDTRCCRIEDAHPMIFWFPYLAFSWQFVCEFGKTRDHRRSDTVFVPVVTGKSSFSFRIRRKTDWNSVLLCLSQDRFTHADPFSVEMRQRFVEHHRVGSKFLKQRRDFVFWRYIHGI